MRSVEGYNQLMKRFGSLMDKIASRWYSERGPNLKTIVKFKLKDDWEKEFEGTYKRPDSHMFI